MRTGAQLTIKLAFLILAQQTEEEYPDIARLKMEPMRTETSDSREGPGNTWAGLSDF